MTDRELLERAAKAAGITLQWQDMLGGYPRYLRIPKQHGKDWNPLADDGDALRLAVKLGMSIDSREGAVCVIDRNGRSVIECGIGSEIYPATRRAIVRAAAAITKGAT